MREWKILDLLKMNFQSALTPGQKIRCLWDLMILEEMNVSKNFSLYQNVFVYVEWLFGILGNK